MSEEPKKIKTWVFENKEFMRCPLCDGAMLKGNSHKCGWKRSNEVFVASEEEKQKPETITTVQTTPTQQGEQYTNEIDINGIESDLYSSLKATLTTPITENLTEDNKVKLAISMFIQKRRERG